MGAVPICPGSFDSFALPSAIVSSLNRTSPQGPGTRCGIECVRTVRFQTGPFSLSQIALTRGVVSVNFARRACQRLALEGSVITDLRTVLECEVTFNANRCKDGAACR